MQEQLSRTELLIGSEGLEKLKNARVAVFGIGGVGGYVVEALARSGVGAFDLIDSDTVALSNLPPPFKLPIGDTVGVQMTPFSAMHFKACSSLYAPCSILSTPAHAAASMVLAPLQCAMTAIPSS